MQIDEPATPDAALALLAEPQVRAVAGATAFQLDWVQGKARPARLVDVARLQPFDVTVGPDGWRSGAGARLDAVAQAVPVLAAALGEVAAPGVRRLGAMCGQIGRGAGCLLPALLVLGAELETSLGIMPLVVWLASPVGLILWVRLPPLPPGAVRVGAGVPRLAVGGGAVAPARTTLVEAWLAAHPAPDPGPLRAAICAAVMAPDCAFRSAAYRRWGAANMLTRAVPGLVDAATAPRRPRPVPRVAAAPAPGHSADPGRWHVRPDLAAKLTGQAGFLNDARSPGMLVGRILRAPSCWPWAGPNSPVPRTLFAVAAIIGPETALAPGAPIGGTGKHRVPLAKPWLAQVLHWQGQPTAQIVRQRNVSGTRVRKWLKAAEVRRGAEMMAGRAPLSRSTLQ